MTGKQKGHKTENHLQFKAMNTLFDIQVIDSNVPEWKNTIFAWIKYVEKEWSRFHEDNEMFRLNHLRVGEKMDITPPLFDVLMQAEHFRVTTSGLFSPYLLSQMLFHGYDQSFPFQKEHASKNTMPAVYDLNTAPFRFDQKTGTIERIADGMVDLGGIGKGYAVQSASQWLKEVGQARAGMVDGGGDITVWSDGRKEWTIGVAHPFDSDQEIAQFRMKNGSIATSNTVYRSWQSGKEKKHHILNGQTGLPANQPIIQATVITDTCLHAEVGAKLCLLVDEANIDSMLTNISPTFSYLLVHKDGSILKQRREARI